MSESAPAGRSTQEEEEGELPESSLSSFWPMPQARHRRESFGAVWSLTCACSPKRKPQTVRQVSDDAVGLPARIRCTTLVEQFEA